MQVVTTIGALRPRGIRQILGPSPRACAFTICVGRRFRWRTNERDGIAHTPARGCRAVR